MWGEDKRREKVEAEGDKSKAHPGKFKKTVPQEKIWATMRALREREANNDRLDSIRAHRRASTLRVESQQVVSKISIKWSELTEEQRAQVGDKAKWDGLTEEEKFAIFKRGLDAARARELEQERAARAPDRVFYRKKKQDFFAKEKKRQAKTQGHPFSPGYVTPPKEPPSSFSSGSTEENREGEEQIVEAVNPLFSFSPKFNAKAASPKRLNAIPELNLGRPDPATGAGLPDSFSPSHTARKLPFTEKSSFHFSPNSSIPVPPGVWIQANPMHRARAFDKQIFQEAPSLEGDACSVPSQADCFVDSTSYSTVDGEDKKACGNKEKNANQPLKMASFEIGSAEKEGVTSRQPRARSRSPRLAYRVPLRSGGVFSPFGSSEEMLFESNPMHTSVSTQGSLNAPGGEESKGASCTEATGAHEFMPPLGRHLATSVKWSGGSTGSLQYIERADRGLAYLLGTSRPYQSGILKTVTAVCLVSLSWKEAFRRESWMLFAPLVLPLAVDALKLFRRVLPICERPSGWSNFLDQSGYFFSESVANASSYAALAIITLSFFGGDELAEAFLGLALGSAAAVGVLHALFFSEDNLRHRAVEEANAAIKKIRVGGVMYYRLPKKKAVELLKLAQHGVLGSDVGLMWQGKRCRLVRRPRYTLDVLYNAEPPLVKQLLAKVTRYFLPIAIANSLNILAGFVPQAYYAPLAVMMIVAELRHYCKETSIMRHFAWAERLLYGVYDSTRWWLLLNAVMNYAGLKTVIETAPGDFNLSTEGALAVFGSGVLSLLTLLSHARFENSTGLDWHAKDFPNKVLALLYESGISRPFLRPPQTKVENGKTVVVQPVRFDQKHLQQVLEAAKSYKYLDFKASNIPLRPRANRKKCWSLSFILMDILAAIGFFCFYTRKEVLNFGPDWKGPAQSNPFIDRLAKLICSETAKDIKVAEEAYLLSDLGLTVEGVEYLQAVLRLAENSGISIHDPSEGWQTNQTDYAFPVDKSTLLLGHLKQLPFKARWAGQGQIIGMQLFDTLGNPLSEKPRCVIINAEPTGEFAASGAQKINVGERGSVWKNPKVDIKGWSPFYLEIRVSKDQFDIKVEDSGFLPVAGSHGIAVYRSQAFLSSEEASLALSRLQGIPVKPERASIQLRASSSEDFSKNILPIDIPLSNEPMGRPVFGVSCEAAAYGDEGRHVAPFASGVLDKRGIPGPFLVRLEAPFDAAPVNYTEVAPGVFISKAAFNENAELMAMMREARQVVPYAGNYSPSVSLLFPNGTEAINSGPSCKLQVDPIDWEMKCEAPAIRIGGRFARDLFKQVRVTGQGPGCSAFAITFPSTVVVEGATPHFHQLSGSNNTYISDKCLTPDEVGTTLSQWNAKLFGELGYPITNITLTALGQEAGDWPINVPIDSTCWPYTVALEPACSPSMTAEEGTQQLAFKYFFLRIIDTKFVLKPFWVGMCLSPKVQLQNVGNWTQVENDKEGNLCYEQVVDAQTFYRKPANAIVDVLGPPGKVPLKIWYEEGEPRRPLGYSDTMCDGEILPRSGKSTPRRASQTQGQTGLLVGEHTFLMPRDEGKFKAYLQAPLPHQAEADNTFLSSDALGFSGPNHDQATARQGKTAGALVASMVVMAQDPLLLFVGLIAFILVWKCSAPARKERRGRASHASKKCDKKKAALVAWGQSKLGLKEEINGPERI